jgi:hypothetical protein
MYHTIVRRKLMQNFQKLNEGDYPAIVAQFSPTAHHVVAGDSALGGERHTREGVGMWYERLFRVFPNLKFTVNDIAIHGMPWNTAITVHFVVNTTLKNGQPYHNSIEQNIILKWAKITKMTIDEDTQKLAIALKIQAEAGISDASAPPIGDV